MPSRMPSRLLEATDTSLNERMEAVRRAVSAKFNQGPGDYSYCEVVFDTYVIVSKASKLWRVDYTVAADGSVVLADSDPVQVRVTYSPVREGTIFGLLPDHDPGQVREGEAPPAPSGKKWGVLIIQEGMSKNRNNYRRKTLQEAAPLYEGTAIYLDHADGGRYGRSTKDKAGFLKDVDGVLLGRTPDGKEAAVPVFALAATAVIVKPSIRQEMLEAWEEGNPNHFGLSHDAECESVACMSPTGPFYDVTRIDAVSSVDLVTNPAAGGRVLRLVASATVPTSLHEDGKMLQKLIEAIKNSGNAALVARLTALGATPSEDQILGLYQESLATPAPAQTATAQVTEAARTAATAAAVPPAAPAVDATRLQVLEAEVREATRSGLGLFLENSLLGCSLPAAVKDNLRTRLQANIGGDKLPTREAITAAIQEQVELFGKLADAGVVLPAPGATMDIRVTKDRRDKVVEAFDAFFGIKREADGTTKIVAAQPMQSFRELYVSVTGDTKVTGQTKECTRLTEALSTTSFDQILGDSITRRMVAEYQQQPLQNWRGVVAEVVPVSDFRTQRRMRFGGYGNLAIVAQGAPYTAMTSPTDEEATYAPAKRGGTESITLEMITNDDVGAIRRIPTKMARAAAQTLHEFVWDFLANNSAIYDSVALANAGHSNIVTTALSSSNLVSLRNKIKVQADMSSGKRIGLSARYLAVPTDLEELAFQLTASDRVVPDSSITTTAAAAAPNFVRKLNIMPIVVDYWTDANNYWAFADPSQSPMIEIGFLGGREEPELFVQDVPNVGSLFSNDVITYKIRHVYGGAVLDYRPFAAGIVT